MTPQTLPHYCDEQMGTQTLKSVTALKGEKPLKIKLRDSLEGYLFVLPAMVIIGVFGLFPVFFTLVVSLHKWRIKQGRFLGMENFLEAFGAIGYLVVLILDSRSLYRFQARKGPTGGQIPRCVSFAAPIRCTAIAFFRCCNRDLGPATVGSG